MRQIVCSLDILIIAGCTKSLLYQLYIMYNMSQTGSGYNAVEMCFSFVYLFL